MTVAWVVGRGGLLGAALERALRSSGTTLFVPSRPFAWSEPDALIVSLHHETARFADAVGDRQSWEVYWAAGVGTMGSVAGALVAESVALDTLLDALGRCELPSGAGRLAFASSAGAIYAGSDAPLIDERTTEAPTTSYARAKLDAEERVRDFADRRGVATLIARMSTLYGVGQTTAKQQGLLTHISRCVVRNRPVQIFVPLDTIRDYLHVDEAASMTIDALRTVVAPHAVVKIVASEQPATISEIVSIFKRVSRRPPRIVTSSAPTSAIYARQMRFRSIVPPLRTQPSSGLALGIDRVLAAERLRYVRGERPASNA